MNKAKTPPGCPARIMLEVWHALAWKARRLERLNYNAIMLSHHHIGSSERIVDKIIEHLAIINSLKNIIGKIEQLTSDMTNNQHGEILRLFFCNKLTYAKLAVQLGLSERTVYRRMPVAIDEFQARFAETGINTFTINMLRREHPDIFNGARFASCPVDERTAHKTQ